MQQLRHNTSWVLEHTIAFPCDDVRVAFLLQVSMVLSFFFLMIIKIKVILMCSHIEDTYNYFKNRLPIIFDHMGLGPQSMGVYTLFCQLSAILAEI